jgi:hypothetical protein
VSIADDLARHLSSRQLRELAMACIATGMAVDAFVTRRARLRAALMQTRSSVWRRLDRPGGALLVAGIALLRASSPAPT